MKITWSDKILLVLKTLWRVPAFALATLPITSVFFAFYLQEYLLLCLAPVVPLLVVLLAKKIDHQATHFNQPIVQRYKLPSCLSWMETPDEYLPGDLSEPLHNQVYKVLGWVGASIYWLLLRNVGGSIMWGRAIPIGNPFPLGVDLDNKSVVEHYQKKALIDRGLNPQKWLCFTLLWEMTKDFNGTKSGRPDENWRTCDYVAKLEIRLGGQ